MKNNNAINIFSKTVYIIFLFFTVGLFSYLFYIKILPTKYLIVFSSIYVVILTLISFFVFFPKMNKIIKLISTIVTMLLTIVLGIGISYLISTIKFMNNLNIIEDNKIEYVLVVKKEYNINSVEELKNKTIGIYINDIDFYEISKLKLTEQIEFIEEEEYDLSELKNKFERDELDAIYLEKLFYTLLTEENEEFNSIVNIITSFFFDNNLDKDENIKVDIVNKPFIAYIGGMDSYGELSSKGRMDVNILMVVNPKTNEILTIHIPRDYYVTLGKINEKDKLNHSGLYGIDITVETIEKLLDIKIDFYIQVNFSSLINLIDVIGGIDVYSEYSFTSFDGFVFKKGMNRMNGEQSLSFSRERMKLPNGDITRGKNQQEVIKAIIDKLTTSKPLLLKYKEILSSLDQSFYTNLLTENIIDFIRNQLVVMNTWDVKMYNIEGIPSYEKTYSYGLQELSVYLENINSIKIAQQEIEKIMNK